MVITREVSLNDFYISMALTCTLVTTARTQIERLPVQAPRKGLPSIASFTPLRNEETESGKGHRPRSELVLSGCKAPSQHTYSSLTALPDPFASEKVHFRAPVGTAQLSVFTESPRSRTEATSASKTNRVEPAGATPPQPWADTAVGF